MGRHGEARVKPGAKIANFRQRLNARCANTDHTRISFSTLAVEKLPCNFCSRLPFSSPSGIPGFQNEVTSKNSQTDSFDELVSISKKSMLMVLFLSSIVFGLAKKKVTTTANLKNLKRKKREPFRLNFFLAFVAINKREMSG